MYVLTPIPRINTKIIDNRKFFSGYYYYNYLIYFILVQNTSANAFHKLNI